MVQIAWIEDDIEVLNFGSFVFRVGNYLKEPIAFVQEMFRHKPFASSLFIRHFS